MDSAANNQFRFIKTFGILTPQHVSSSKDIDNSLCAALISGHIAFVIQSGNFYVFNVSVDSLSYYASFIGLPSFIYYDGAFMRYVYENKHTYSRIDVCLEIEIPQALFCEVDERLSENLKQVKGFKNPSDAIDFIVSRVGFYPHYLRANINKGIHKSIQ